MRKICLLLIRFYQRAISPLKRPCCRFYPSCSAYAYEAFRRHGVIKGGFLAMKRILRCNPLFQGGIDYVPEEFSFFKKITLKEKNGKE